jgi:hypothetical protein
MRKTIFNLSLFIVAGFVLSSCVSDGFVPLPEEEDPYDQGLLADASRDYVDGDVFNGDKSGLRGGYSILDLAGSPLMTEDEFKEFESYRAWLKSREKGTDEYKEYEAWRAYRDQKSAESVNAP